MYPIVANSDDLGKGYLLEKSRVIRLADLKSLFL
ncbi:unnamed protein product [Schistosoma curassoni]|uniref:Phosphoribosylaminoimidazolesuccinocarboxamide synthase n=1 Tax=Schistosoma curassoni TaxID=6186 RepID=A0A183K8X3_9TREM|nr:unnamed protein product [Schistosoma curassoni]